MLPTHSRKRVNCVQIYIFLNLNITWSLACFVCHCCCKTEGEVSATPCNAWTMQRMYISPTQLDCRGKYCLVGDVFFLEYTSKTLQECETALTSRYWTCFFAFLYFCLCLFVFLSLCLCVFMSWHRSDQMSEGSQVLKSHSLCPNF